MHRQTQRNKQINNNKEKKDKPYKTDTRVFFKIFFFSGIGYYRERHWERDRESANEKVVVINTYYT